jgi:hypothetical protein
MVVFDAKKNFSADFFFHFLVIKALDPDKIIANPQPCTPAEN